MIRVYTGEGKGKTTSAIGQALIASSRGAKILILQFLKGSTYMGELYGLNRLGIPLVQFGVGCKWAGMIRTGLRHCTGCGECFRKNRDPEFALPLVREGLTFLKEQVQSSHYEMIILDEVSHALNRGFLPSDELRSILQSAPAIDWILTGRNFPQEWLGEVDEWWELKAVKHPFQEGIRSRRGIEY
ncbi:cob(I)yrinic acid a,c-diamide adenosyltransferase [Desulfitobacterium sp.]|uniref:cob(I)yrinic acid a,c-diamide adenosyltransferase n=1 Tax=Desulfitobacterium sp. TaxID=49981 RepID=UPI002C502314|nr:cob(I)yrinic acid a,c-diamide adenosyltransferase [Desulfitobacterium sp.]HVJ48288.1 cob(I)yrinic acid a,c-diamide adenosyltransferase [Desulfitobacterium sp.]